MYRILMMVGLMCLPMQFNYAHSEVQYPEQYVSTQVAINGLVNTPLTLDVNALKQFPQQSTQRVAITTMKGQLRAEAADFKGVLLTDLLNQAEIIRKDHNDVKKMVIVATASDGYKAIFSWNELFNSPNGQGIIIVYQKNGLPLDPKAGQIALLSTRDLASGPRFVKWLKEISVLKVTD
ncbi:molybdopterin-dependent oxidoreductase [Acinetobacter sp. NIPH 2699]|uniref:molybdopterin-dependent oxidoreductase n=1 Tax=Acinetobacter sp. NIPH 2699 TaxID=2923433 RepID=UPI001F4A9645|nr:molybdopterin-dependent oxidoreductase [Acinetobacter sp. NIPH 2699]MCH7336658.1 molybdopterin-dependent oxidoreductase [Acinetobacter sp. NIPH 2699]